ncbi:MAG: HAD family hydrolase [Planctomycetota bacterium]|jgi:HAD superfamily hydrolase (TIGR01509 family)
MPHSAVIFDMDGVLVDSEPLHKDADREALLSVGLDVPAKVLQEYAGMGGEAFFSSILERFGAGGDPEALCRVKNRALESILSSLSANTPPVPGVMRLLTRVEALGWPMAVASSSDKKIVTLVLSNLAISERFPVVVTGGEVPRGKPAPDIFLLAAKRLSVRPSRCLVIEDSRTGSLAARSAGMVTLGLYNPLSGDQDLSASHLVVDSLDAVDTDLLRSLLPD